MTTSSDRGYPKITHGLKERDAHLDDLGLGHHVLELERWGYTVVRRHRTGDREGTCRRIVRPRRE